MLSPSPHRVAETLFRFETDTFTLPPIGHVVTNVPSRSRRTACGASAALTSLESDDRGRHSLRDGGKFFIVRADVGERTIFHAESARNGSEPSETKPFVEATRREVALDDGVELEDAKPMRLRLRKAVENEPLTDVPTTAFRADGIARVADVPTAPDIVRMEYVEAGNPPAFVHRDPGVGLHRKETPSGIMCQRLFLRKCVSRLHNLVPDGDHAVNVTVNVFSYCHLLPFVESQARRVSLSQIEPHGIDPQFAAPATGLGNPDRQSGDQEE